jgi:hypothetical protein
MARSDEKPDLISAETAAVMAMMNLGELATNIATYRAHCSRFQGAESADIYRMTALEELGKVRAALEKIDAILTAAAPAAKAAA